ncbi:PREDICTED: 5-hydroxytryptamine receptor 2A-like [Dinoponera quadriceps]|uniref:5-hydroxytryptamine receptor 2A-like n=1 Tax=Dinoponera quadriceps TaxID=609295 RepID=A0A6P3Y5F1_DINQU|nr:PREDICTED: 5-hydroxytryptamine receptor 2A-like [Dinoponera quadriceps]XP_014485558.1 PREDICTED: 5-hydroxytryptamine receptor 2A-like [Dinoponera quadriceps]
MEVHVNQAVNASVEDPVFIDASIVLRALVLFLLILVTILGNLFVIMAIVLERNLQSVANYLIVSLAVADLMVACLVMPFGALYEIKSGWSLGPVLCDIWTSSDVLCCTASILHLVAIAVDRYWAVTDINYIQARNPRRIGILIGTVWVVSLGISLAPQFGWKDPDYLDRITEGTCLITQDTAYQIFATCATFYVPLFVILILYWRIFQAARSRIRRRPGTILQPPRERRGILRLVTRRPREESTAFTITRSTPDHSSISPEKSSSYNGANVTPSATVTPTAVSTTTTTTTLTNPTSTSQQQQVVSTKRTRETIESKRERKAAKTLAIITGAFVACWLPFFLVALLQAVCQTCKPPNLVSSVFLWLGYFNSTLNPVIYTVFSPEFRQAFKRMLCGGTRGLR